LRTIAGSTEFCELFLDEVRIPVANRVGEENDGWRVTNVTLSFERGTAFVSELVQSMELVRHLATVARRVTSRSGAAWDDAGIRRELGYVAADLEALWALTKRNVSMATRTGSVGVGGSVFKLHYSEARHRLGDLAMRILERASLSMDDVGDLASGRHVEGEIHAISISIAAGTSQIQRNIVAERMLGLPREQRWTSS
jgi:alkylation response protein AidB-like acyl-CoA dehydrogenase